MVTTAEVSNTALTTIGVLHQISELAIDTDKTSNSALSAKSNSRRNNNTYERCVNGVHNPKNAHNESVCREAHPELRKSASSNVATITGRALSALACNGNSSGKPILDSGASQTMVHDMNLFSSYQPYQARVNVANGQSIQAIGVGSVQGKHKGETVTLSNCLHVPDIKSNLVSLGHLAKKGCSIKFGDNGHFDVLQDTDVALSGSLAGGVMELDLELGKSYAILAKAAHLTNGMILHSRLGHPGPAPFKHVHPHSSHPISCDPCILSKHHRLPYKGNFKTANEPLELLHSDLSGIISPPSLGSARYFLKITDSSTSFKFVYILRHKSNTLSCFMQFKAFVKNQTSLKIKNLVNDNGGEYLSKDFTNFVSKHGIQMHLTAPYTPEQNPVAERGNRTTVEKARTLLKHAGLPA